MDGVVADVPLKNEDVVFIPTQDELRKERYFSVTGQVMSPGSYEYAENTTIEDLIVMAGGLRDGASLARVDVSRRIKDPYSTEKTRNIAETFQFDIKDGLVIKKDGKEFYLQPYDVVHVRRSPGYVMPRNIRVTGEVNYEGAFTIEKKDLRLTDAIKMAGGVAPGAYTKGARLVRRMNDMELARRNMAVQTARQGQGARDSVSLEKLAIDSVYTVGIHLDEALKHPGSDADIVLREGDELYVPEFEGTVKISGDVMYANTVAYSSGKNFKWYVKQAGGFGQRAKKSKAYVVYPNGTMAMAKRNTEITPGCEIVVPSKPKKESVTASQWVNLGTGIAGIISTIAVLIIYMTK